ncbi:MAG: hypothetical protein ABII76_13890, partial [Pseudomonadota bacterium]
MSDAEGPPHLAGCRPSPPPVTAAPDRIVVRAPPPRARRRAATQPNPARHASPDLPGAGAG